MALLIKKPSKSPSKRQGTKSKHDSDVSSARADNLGSSGSSPGAS
jgi:hypothetical protein